MNKNQNSSDNVIVNNLRRMGIYVLFVLLLLLLAFLVGSIVLTPIFKPSNFSSFLGISDQLGMWALPVAFASISIWLIRQVYMEAKDNKKRGIIRSTLMFFRQHHKLLGWLLVGLSTLHGIYFLIIYPQNRDNVITGLYAWFALISVLIAGFLLQIGTIKAKKLKIQRIIHSLLSLAFVVILFFHVIHFG